jgi:hypothetical protein
VVGEPGRGAVDLHLPGGRLTGDGVGEETRAVVQVDDVHLLVLGDLGELEQSRIDSQ